MAQLVSVKDVVMSSVAHITILDRDMEEHDRAGGSQNEMRLRGDIFALFTGEGEGEIATTTTFLAK